MPFFQSWAHCAVGKADKPPAWKGSSVERWQEYTVSLQAWHAANKNFMTEAQAIHKVYQPFRDAGEGGR